MGTHPLEEDAAANSVQLGGVRDRGVNGENREWASVVGLEKWPAPARIVCYSLSAVEFR